jgi:hypothetical protein
MVGMAWKIQNPWTEPNHPLWITIPKSVDLVGPSRDWSSGGAGDHVDNGFHHHHATTCCCVDEIRGTLPFSLGPM